MVAARWQLQGGSGAKAQRLRDRDRRTHDFKCVFWQATPNAAARLSATAETLAVGQTSRKASLKSKPRNLGDMDGVFLTTLLLVRL